MKNTTSKPGTVTWTADCHPATLEVSGSPRLIPTPLGPALEFDGKGDGIWLDSVPVAGLEECTIEMIFKPYGGSEFEQRYFHIGESAGPRVMMELRMNPDDRWYLDSFFYLDDERKKTLLDTEKTHPADKWYNITYILGKDGTKSYVDGVLECSDSFPYEPGVNTGMTSLGVRLNKVCWFKGAILKIRFTPKQLRPKEFLTDAAVLNRG